MARTKVDAAIRFDEIAVVVTGKDGTQFRKDWKATANRSDVILWTLPYVQDYEQMVIAKVEIIENTDTLMTTGHSTIQTYHEAKPE